MHVVILKGVIARSVFLLLIWSITDQTLYVYKIDWQKSRFCRAQQTKTIWSNFLHPHTRTPQITTIGISLEWHAPLPCTQPNDPKRGAMDTRRTIPELFEWTSMFTFTAVATIPWATTKTRSSSGAIPPRALVKFTSSLHPPPCLPSKVYCAFRDEKSGKSYIVMERIGGERLGQSANLLQIRKSANLRKLGPRRQPCALILTSTFVLPLRIPRA